MVGKKGIETVDDANAEAQREVTVNQLIESTQCSHVSRYRGHSVRTSESHLIRPGDNARVMKIPKRAFTSTMTSLVVVIWERSSTVTVRAKSKWICL